MWLKWQKLKRILKAALTKQKVNHKWTPISFQWSSQQKLPRPKGSGIIHLKWCEGEIYNQESLYLTDFHLDLMQRSSFTDKQKLKEFSTTKSLYKKCKRVFQSKKEKAKTKNMKLKRGKVLIVEGKYTTKLDQPHRKQVGKLKEKNSKITHICN